MRLNKYLNEDDKIEFLNQKREVKNEIDVKFESITVKNPRGYVYINHYVYVEENNKWFPFGKSKLELYYQKDKGWVMSSIHVEDKMRHKGIATKMIKLAVKETNSSLYTTEVLSDLGKSLLKGIIRKGWAEKTKEGHIINKNKVK